jgi:hypothetical protein
MTKNTWFSLFILIISYQIGSNEECPLIDDCNYRISDINELNNQYLVLVFFHGTALKNHF